MMMMILAGAGFAQNGLAIARTDPILQATPGRGVEVRGVFEGRSSADVIAFRTPFTVQVQMGADGLEGVVPELGLVAFGDSVEEVLDGIQADLHFMWQAYVVYAGPLDPSAEAVRATLLRHRGDG